MRTLWRKWLPLSAALALCLTAAVGCGSDPAPGPSEEESSTAVQTTSAQAVTTQSTAAPAKTTAAAPFDEKAFMKAIRPAIDCLKSCSEELFGAEADFTKPMSAAYEEAGDGRVLAKLYPQDQPLPDGYLVDESAALYFPVTNFSTIAQVRAHLQQYMTDEFIKTLPPLEYNFAEIEGQLYLYRGGRGYGTLVCVPDTLRYEGEEEAGQTVCIDYHIHEEYDHTNRLTFVPVDGGWRLAAARTVESVNG